MKTIFKQSRILSLFMLIFLLTTGISCKDQKSQKDENDLNEQIDQLEDDDSFAGSSKRDDLCQLLTEKDVRLAFDLSEAIEIKQEKDRNAICSYKWEDPESKYLSYTVSLNFASGAKRTKSQIDKAWESQNNGIYAKHNMQPVTNVGDKASWSDLGGGQLRVASETNIFYVSFFVFPKNKNPMDTQEMIDKASTLAKKVIERM